MAADDHAILVGISRYADAAVFPELRGPFNDVALVRHWLTSPDGGGLDPANVTTILSPRRLAPDVEPDDVPPVTEDFKRAFKRVVRDAEGRVTRRDARLYLYFSGHGFCERKSLNPQGALYAANATRDFPENIYGTFYALSARDKALFSEIVLVMDCCRDAEVNRSPDIPPINEAGVGAATTVKLLCIYAAPKGGKAQERPIAERGGKVFGLLTHALCKALTEAVPDAGNHISATALRDHLLGTWKEVCGAEAAPAPEVVLPTTAEDLLLRSGNAGVECRFVLADHPGAPVALELTDGALRPVARCELRRPPETSTVRRGSAEPRPLAFDGERFALDLQPGFYRYALSGALARQALFAVESAGGDDVRL
ncbi:MAG: caspase family protein [Ectothiorhodospiraceae bacterium]|nr:caspase family protein [Ectothiorhodospiraceae bacterium]